MILTTDKEYTQTKAIKQGKKEMLPEFKELAKWINETYKVNTLNVIYDMIDTVGGSKTPRVKICVEYSRDMAKFKGNNNGYDGEKQNLISAKFKELMANRKLLIKEGLFSMFSKNGQGKYRSKNLFVCFSAFEPTARQEAQEKITENEIEQLKHEINDENLWGIVRGYGLPTFFLYTDEQVKKYEYSEKKNEWIRKYFALVEKYDEFKYFRKEFFNIYLDSKETFDTKYQGNWYYYFK